MILGVAGRHNSGKTTLLEILIPAVVEAGFTVATVKHVAGGDLSIDKGGSDTQRHKGAGAVLAAAVSDGETVYFHPRAHTLDEVLARIEQLGPFDLVLVEGYKASPLPKIVVGRVKHNGPAAYRWNGEHQDALRIAQALVSALRSSGARARRSKRRA